ncbi:MAG: 6-bladed beta-propeller [Gemmatimonadota bacterium]
MTIRASPDEIAEWSIDDTESLIRGEPGSASPGAPALARVSDGFWLSDGRILVVDVGADAMHLYDSAGRFIRTFGRNGSGPREFSWIRSVSVIGEDSIVAYDAALRAVKIFHPDHGFVRSERIDSPRGATGSAEAWRLPGNRYVYLTSSPADPAFDLAAAAEALGPGEIRELPEVATLDLIGGDSILADPIQFPGTSSGLFAGGSVLQPFAAAPVVHVDSSLVYFGSGRTFTITEVDSDFELRRVIRWPAFQEPLRTEEVDSLRDVLADAGFGRSAVAAMLSDELTPDTRPAVGRIAVDSERRIWVARFEPRIGLASERILYVLRPSGRPLAKVRLRGNRRARLLDVRGRRVLLLTWDDFDVPTIESGTLRRG